jgi:hypothetical protein
VYQFANGEESRMAGRIFRREDGIDKYVILPKEFWERPRRADNASRSKNSRLQQIGRLVTAGSLGRPGSPQPPRKSEGEDGY